LDLAAAHQIVLRAGWLSRTPPLFQRVHEIVGKDLGAWRYIALVTIGHLEMAIGACDVYEFMQQK
jgi:hypothetical protein